MANKQKSYKEQLMELYGAGAQSTGTGAAQAGTAQTGAGTTQTAQSGQSGNAMLDLILNRPGFSYNANTDPAAQAARKEAARNASLATNNTLGSYAGMTGGIPSTAAVSAAAQAGNAAMQQGADKVAQLRELAYQNYQTEGANMQAIAALMQQQEAANYAKEQDVWAREQTQKEWDYGVAQDEYEKQLALAQLKAAYGDYSGLKALGVDTSKYTSGGSSGGNGSYSYTPRVADPTPQDDDPGDGGGSGIPASVSDSWWIDYGGVLPAEVWASAAAQYGEQALINAGFSKAKAASGGAAGQPGKTKPGAGNNRIDLMQ